MFRNTHALLLITNHYYTITIWSYRVDESFKIKRKVDYEMNIQGLSTNNGRLNRSSKNEVQK